MSVRIWACAVLGLTLAGSAAAVPVSMNHQGRVTAAGVPVTGLHDLTVSLYTTPTGGTPVWTDTLPVNFVDGYYAIVIGDRVGNTIDEDLFAGGVLHLGVAVDTGAELAPRSKVATVPYARRAAVAESVAGGAVDASEIRVNGELIIDEDGNIVGPASDDTLTRLGLQCGDDEIPRWNDGLALWDCGPDDVRTDLEIREAVRASVIDLKAGSTLGGQTISTGAHTVLDWNAIPNVPGDLKDGDADALGALSSRCSSGDIPKWNPGASRWDCGPDSGGATLTGDQVRTMVGQAPVFLTSGSTVGGLAISTITTTDVRGVVEGPGINLASGSRVGGAPISTLTLSEVRTSIQGPGLALDASTTVGGQPISTGSHLTLSAVGTYLGAGVALGSGSTIGGSAILTSAALDSRLAAGLSLGAGSTVAGSAIVTTAALDSRLAGAVALGAGSTVAGADIATLADVSAAVATLADEQTQQDILARLEDLLEMLAPTSCPSDMVMGGKPGTETAFCIEKTERGATFYQNAMMICHGLGRHVCTVDEWYIGSQTSGTSQMCNNNWEWTGDRDHAHSSGYLQVQVGAAECTRQTWDWTDQHNNGSPAYAYRCCLGGLSVQLD